MKKILLTIFSGVLLAGTASAQCTPNIPQGAEGNFFPDSADFIMNQYAVAGSAYEAQIDILTIADTLVANPINPAQFIEAVIDGFRLFSVEWTGPAGEAAGFTFTGGGATYEQQDPTNYNQPADSTWWNAYGTANDPSTVTPVEGCLSITADAAAVSAAAPATGFTDYPVIVNVDARIVQTTPDVSFLLSNGSWLSESGGLVDPLPVDGYVLRVYAQDPNNVTELLNTNVFDVAQSYPNPADDEATITFTTPRMENIDVKVFNMLGAVVYDQTILSESGVNDVKINTGRMSSGLYIYTVSNGTKTFTKKMTVK